MKVEQYLKQQGVQYEKHLHSTTYTAQGLAQAEHVSGYMVAKPVIVKGASGFAMCVIPAPKHVDLKKVAEAMNEREVRLATESEMAQLFPDTELGAEPPIGRMFDMNTVMDQQLREDEELVMQAGTHTESIRIKRAVWEKINEPLAADICLS